jgi:sec-independent protein translocase protein TatB
MKETMEGAARDVENSVQTTAIDFEKQWDESTAGLTADTNVPRWEPPPPVYKHPGKKFRLKQAAVPQWYKSRAGVRTKTLSGAARVARYRPTKLGSY